MNAMPMFVSHNINPAIVPPKNTLMEMAKILNVNYIHLFQLIRNSGKYNAFDDKSVRYYNNDD